ncbi:MAG TPA: hypothetical protein VGJ20_25280 [Xanthobacteraceae bacterium]|jgi:hypothetical protein
MKKLLAGCALLPLLAGVAMAGQPTTLSDTQMDHVTAGLALWFATNSSVVVFAPATAPPGVVVTNFLSLDGVGPPMTGFPSVTVTQTARPIALP